MFSHYKVKYKEMFPLDILTVKYIFVYLFLCRHLNKGIEYSLTNLLWFYYSQWYSNLLCQLFYISLKIVYLSSNLIEYAKYKLIYLTIR